MPTLEQVLNDARQLAPDEQYQLAMRLLESGDAEEREPGYEEAWAAEIARRFDRVNAGEPGVPLNEAFERIFARPDAPH